jgi:8-hydroxy-5-deazaflavin:NADPH oxidoreductase
LYRIIKDNDTDLYRSTFQEIPQGDEIMNVMVCPQHEANGAHHVFVSGNDAQVKEPVVDILKSFGWIHILNLGDITTARATEMDIAIWLRLWGALGTGMFNIKVMN